MRLWHQALLPYLSRQRLSGQHRECCALRGNGWGRKHATVQYVFNHPYTTLCQYHMEVIAEMEKRGYHVDKQWKNWPYRGKKCKAFTLKEWYDTWCIEGRTGKYLYPEHDDTYLIECLEILRRKGEDIRLIVNRKFDIRFIQLMKEQK